MARKRKSRGAPKEGSKPERQPENAFKLRILDLSAETRKRIYELALTLKERGGCSTNLLLTCKQINEEATPYLYNNTAKLHFHTARVNPFGGKTLLLCTLLEKRSNSTLLIVRFNGPNSCAEWKA
jgi:hypothetical protein